MPGAGPARGAGGSADEEVRMGKAKILVVDDDEALAEMIGIVLRNDGF